MEIHLKLNKMLNLPVIFIMKIFISSLQKGGMYL